MQAQQSKPAKPTVGQIMAAKRAKKREQEIERLAKAKIGNKSIDRNKASELEFIQYKNRKAMCEGEPHSEDVNINNAIKNLEHYRLNPRFDGAFLNLSKMKHILVQPWS